MLTLFLFTQPLLSVDSSLDSRGNEFYVSFLPNYHSTTNMATDSVYLFIAVQEPTNVTIYRRNVNGNLFTPTKIFVNKTDQVYKVAYYYKEFEIPGLNYLNVLYSTNTEKISSPYFKITSDKDISVIGYSEAGQTNDAFLVLPTHSLGNHHLVLAYKNHFSPITGGQKNQNNSTPSEFVVLASQNSTNVKIIPKCKTTNSTPDTINVLLNEGDSYLVTALVDYKNRFNDLTGSEVISDKPIALFAGQQRAFIPYNPKSADTNGSRDIVVEQIPAINFWGRNCFIVPFETPSNDSKKLNDIYRILSAFDDNEIKVNGIVKYKLNKGQFIEDTLDVNHIALIEADKPILSAGYKKTSTPISANIGGNLQFVGDPFMLLFPPKEQFSKVYLTINPQIFENGSSKGTFTDQFITIIVPESANNTVLIDNIPVPQIEFKRIATSDYFYTAKRVSDGSHTVKADAEIGIYIYGYGLINSYGYLGGISAKHLDFNPPELESVYNCPSATGTITDTNIYDSGFLYPNSIKTPIDSMINTSFFVPKYKDGEKKVNFQIDLINKLQDGSIQIVVTDSMGIVEKKHVDLPGFTIAFKNSALDTSKYFIGAVDSIAFHKPKCKTFTIQNYGKFTHTFNLKMGSDSSGFTVSPDSLTLKPGETKDITTCFGGADTAYQSDIILTYNNCISRKIAFVQGYVFYDKNNPQIESSSDGCNQNFYYTLADTLAFDSGIKTISFTDSTNISVATYNNSISKTIKLIISVVDLKQDATYKLKITDSSGKFSEISNIVPGNTLNFGKNGKNITIFSFDTVNIGDLKCLEIPINNFGNFPITIKNLKLKNNIKFSSPYSQFPFIIKPQTEEKIIICFTSSIQSKSFDYDTLDLSLNCFESQLVVKARAENYEMNSYTSCNLSIKIDVNKILQQGLIVFPISPNPTSNIVNIDFNIDKESIISVEILNQMGEVVKTPFLNNLNQGEYNMNFNISDLSSGTYFVKLKSEKYQNIQQIYLIK